jgi:hypothetical protein
VEVDGAGGENSGKGDVSRCYRRGGRRKKNMEADDIDGKDGEGKIWR